MYQDVGSGRPQRCDDQGAYLWRRNDGTDAVATIKERCRDWNRKQHKQERTTKTMRYDEEVDGGEAGMREWGRSREAKPVTRAPFDCLTVLGVARLSRRLRVGAVEVPLGSDWPAGVKTYHLWFPPGVAWRASPGRPCDALVRDRHGLRHVSLDCPQEELHHSQRHWLCSRCLWRRRGRRLLYVCRATSFSLDARG